MTAATADRPDVAERAQATKYKMALRDACYSTEMGGRLPAGAVVLTDEATAIRWYELGIADPADPATPTHFEHVRNQKREAFLKQAKPVSGAFDQMVTRGRAPSRPRPRRADLDGVTVVNDTSDEAE